MATIRIKLRRNGHVVIDRTVPFDYRQDLAAAVEKAMVDFHAASQSDTMLDGDIHIEFREITPDA